MSPCLLRSAGIVWICVQQLETLCLPLAPRRAKEHEGVIADKDRAAMAAQGKLREYQRGIAPLHDELENVRR